MLIYDHQAGRPIKRFLPAVLRDLHFQAAPAGEHTLSAIHYLTELNGSKKRILDNAPEHIITGPWKLLVYDAEGRISPLMHGHINMLGHYTFTLPEGILKGELRALNFNLNNELPS